jgi:hypothetical protein
MQQETRFERATAAFDQYNSMDPNKEEVDSHRVPKELLYAQRMTSRLLKYLPDSSEYLQLAARAQHIGRWEIPRSQYPINKKGYFQWRNKLKDHHSAIVEPILKTCGYNSQESDTVKSLILKKNLATNPDTQVLEDVICLVFLEYYFEEFAAKHNDEKVVDILRKTIRKMSTKAIKSVAEIPINDKIKSMIYDASNKG